MRLTRLSLTLVLSLAAQGLAFAQSAPITVPGGGSTAPAARPVAPPAATPAAPTPAKPELLDINSATAEQLDALPGIGAVRTAAIIKGRPYKGKDELVQKGIVPKNVYDAIKDKIIARQK